MQIRCRQGLLLNRAYDLCASSVRLYHCDGMEVIKDILKQLHEGIDPTVIGSASGVELLDCLKEARTGKVQSMEHLGLIAKCCLPAPASFCASSRSGNERFDRFT